MPVQRDEDDCEASSLFHLKELQIIKKKVQNFIPASWPAFLSADNDEMPKAS